MHIRVFMFCESMWLPDHALDQSSPDFVKGTRQRYPGYLASKSQYMARHFNLKNITQSLQSMMYAKLHYEMCLTFPLKLTHLDISDKGPCV